MNGSGRPPDGWWRASDGQLYPIEQLPPGWAINAEGEAQMLTPASAASIGGVSRGSARAGGVIERLRSLPLWVKIMGPIGAVLLLSALGNAGSNSDQPKQASLLPVSTTLPITSTSSPSTSTSGKPPTTTAPPTTAAPVTTAIPVATAAPVVQATAPPATAAPDTSPPTTSRPATTPPPRTGVTPGAFCPTEGATGYSASGIVYTCKTSAADDRTRWRQ